MHAEAWRGLGDGLDQTQSPGGNVRDSALVHGVDDVPYLKTGFAPDHGVRVHVEEGDSLLVRVERGAQTGDGEQKKVRKSWKKRSIDSNLTRVFFF